MEFVKENSPHIHRKDSLFRMMLDVLIALLPVVVAAFVYYPLAALRNILVSCATMVLAELVFVIIMNSAKKKDGEDFKPLAGYSIDNVMVPLVSGVIYALIMPVATDQPGFIYYALIMGALFGIIIGKLVFGGTGKNIFNPAAVGMVFAKLCFGSHYVYPTAKILGEVTTGETALSSSLINIKNSVVNLTSYSLLDMFLGKIPGVLGETCKIAVLLGLIYLIIRHTIDWRIPLAYIGTFAFMMLVVGLILQGSPLKVNAFQFLAYELLSGGLLFGAVYMATDPVTSPMSYPGRWIYGAALGAMTVLIRLFASIPEGVVFSILLGNMLVPFIDYQKWFSNKFTWKKGLALCLTILIPTLIVIWAVCVEVF